MRISIPRFNGQSSVENLVSLSVVVTGVGGEQPGDEVTIGVGGVTAW
jgi:hypothetical protein